MYAYISSTFMLLHLCRNMISCPSIYPTRFLKLQVHAVANKRANFSFLNNLERIPKHVYIAWPDVNVLTSNLTVPKIGVQALIANNPKWTFHLYDDRQIDDFLRAHLNYEDYTRVQDEHIVEKSDLWRLLVMYHYGGYYQDVDRPSVPHLDSLLTHSVRMCLPISGKRRYHVYWTL